jgi:hypothetical protein
MAGPSEAPNLPYPRPHRLSLEVRLKGVGITMIFPGRSDMLALIWTMEPAGMSLTTVLARPQLARSPAGERLPPRSMGNWHQVSRRRSSFPDFPVNQFADGSTEGGEGGVHFHS